MATITTKAGPWNMTVFSYDQTDPENPLGRLSAEIAARLPFGAAELDRDGVVLSYNDTEPGDGGSSHGDIVGRTLFGDLIGIAPNSVVAQEFAKGVASGELNVVFDCGVAGLAYRVRLHFKVSPILGTYWVFIKKLRRSAA